MVVSTHLYDLLQVAPDASPAEIKKAYRKQSLANHPDKNPDVPQQESSEKFAEINHAYETLIDDESRDAYDRYGDDGPGGGGGMPPDMDDFLASMFGGGAGAGASFGGMPRTSRSRKTRGQDAIIEYKVTLADLYLGKTAHFNMTKNIICLQCNGSGAKLGCSEKDCVKCSGKGKLLQQRSMGNGMIAQSWVECTDCNGYGKKVRDKDRCKKCRGEKTIKSKAKLDVVIEKGMVDGQKIVFKQEADQEPGVQPGDIIIQLSLQPDAAFQIKGLDLMTTVRLTLSEALLGFSRTILTHLDGRHIKVSRSKITRPGDIQVVKGEGMPRYNDRNQFRGDLYIVWEVDFPTDAQLATDLSEIRTTLASVLPPGRPDLEKTQNTVEDDVEPVNTKPEQFGSNLASISGYDDDEAWEDEDAGGGPGMSCAPQ